MQFKIVALSIVMLLFCGCGGGGSATTDTVPPPLTPKLILHIQGQILKPGESRSIRIDSTEDATTTDWVLSGGTIQASGNFVNYTAPVSPGRYSIKGSLRGHPDVSVTLAIYVISIQVEAISTLLEAPGSGKYFTANGLPDGRIVIDNFSYWGPMIWDPLTRICSRTGTCQVHTLFPETAILNSGKLVQIGSGNWGEADAHDILEYDPQGDIWSKVGETYYLRNGDQSSTVMKDGRLLLAGGQTGSGGENPTMEIWDPALGGVATFFSFMQRPRAGHTATLLPDGSVLIAGGWSGYASVYDSEIVTPNLESILGPTMKTDRFSAVALPLSDGRIFYAGGGLSPELELFDPVKMAFEYAGTLDTQSFMEPAASRLPSDMVLLMGGSTRGGGTHPSDAVQIWVPELRECRTLANLPKPITGAKAVAGRNGITYLLGGVDSLNSSTEVFAITLDSGNYTRTR